VKLALLELRGISIIDFPKSPDWTLENLQKLSLDIVKFPNPLDFKNFSGFLKTLGKLIEVSLRVRKEKTDIDGGESDESDEDHDEELADEEKERKFVEVLTELFSLPNLRKLSFQFDHENQLGRMANVKVQNPGVEELTLKRIPIEGNNKYSQFVKIFPNVRKAKLDFNFSGHFDFVADDEEEIDLMPINSWTSLKELELSQVKRDMLSQVKNIRSIKINDDCGIYSSSWKNFCQNNPQLEHLDFNCEGFSFLSFRAIAENMPNLKVLILQTIWLGHNLCCCINAPEIK
jgi:hypothetical protein